MNVAELNKIRIILRHTNDKLKVAYLTNKQDRTLIFGHTSDSKYYHLYLESGQLYEVTYSPFEYPMTKKKSDDFIRIALFDDVFISSILLKVDTIYSEASDFETVIFIVSRGYIPKICAYSEQRADMITNAKYHGLLGFDD